MEMNLHQKNSSHHLTGGHIMIPKIIHYCWFGGNELNELAKKCIKSWKKYCKGYKFIEWNENNFDIDSAPLFVRQAYEAKKWAFVSDYVRLYAITKFGGVYMDTDVEVVASIDKFLSHQAFSSFQGDECLQTGVMACEKNFPLFVDFLKYYDTAVFINEDGTLNTKPNTDIITEACESRGLIQNNTLQTIDGFVIYPNDYFCPINMTSGRYQRTDNTVTIHWFSGSWLPDDLKKQSIDETLYYTEKNNRYLKKQRRHKIACLPRKILGDKLYLKIRSLVVR